MERCHCCGNISSRMLIVEDGGERYAFDSFLCAAYLLAPTCSQCGNWILDRPVTICGHRFCDIECAQIMAPRALAFH